MLAALKKGKARGLGSTSLDKVLENFFNSPQGYLYCLKYYNEGIEKYPKILDWVRTHSDHPRFYSAVRANREALIVHLLEMPLSEVLMYIHVHPDFISIIAKWRLRIGR